MRLATVRGFPIEAPMTLRVLPLVLLASLAAAQGQTTLTAHPQETLQENTGNLVPLGVLGLGSTALFAEGTTQILVPKEELPTTPCFLTGLEFLGGALDTVDYASLTITVGPTTATSLSPTFANNFPVPGTTVVQLTNQPITWTSAAFVGVPFAQNYVHDGVSGMVIEIRKVVQAGANGWPFMTMGSSSSPSRNDRPVMAYAFTGPGGGGANATQASVFANSIVHRMLWNLTPTVRNLSDVGASGNQYNIGSTVTVTVGGNPGELFVLAAGVGYLPAGVPIPGFGGALLLNGPVIFASGLIGALGEATTPVALPNNPAVVGFHIFYQAATVDPVSGTIVLTNGSDHFVNA
jgi:hypothetical protein